MKNIGWLFLPAVLLLSACQKGKEKPAAQQASPAFDAQRNAFFGNLKNPSETAIHLQAIVPEFNPDLINSPKQFTLYTYNPVKASANLGIYLSDLNYSIAYQQDLFTTELFSASYELSKVVGVERNILDFLKNRYNENLSRKDSVKAVVETLFDKSTAGLKGTERERFVGIAMVAYQIENLHLALGLIESTAENTHPDDAHAKALVAIYGMVAAQKINLEITYRFLQSITDLTDPDKNPNYPYYTSALKSLIEVYRRLDMEGKLAGHQNITLMSEDIKELIINVDAVRNKIISEV